MKPIVAIVGRPNVGKSTLFNRLSRRRLAIVYDQPGVTRDLNYADVTVGDHDVTLVDTGGFDLDSVDPLGRGIAENVQSALREADVVVCVLDATAAPTNADRDAAKLLRATGKPTVYVANKADNPGRQLEANALYELGLDHLVAVSAAHGIGMAELVAAIVAVLPPAVSSPCSAPATDAAAVAIVGRPNAGKSSLFNRMVGANRSLVDAEPGTTRDPVDCKATLHKHDFLFVDTAGIRRRSRVDPGVEAASVMRAIRAIERAQIALILCDITEGVAEQDARLVGLCCDRGRAVLIALNKIDLVSPTQRERALEDARTRLHFAPWVSVLQVSARTGDGIRVLTRSLLEAKECHERRIPTAALNRFFEQVLERRPPPARGRKPPRIYYITQARTKPPEFVAMCSSPAAIDNNYRRFVNNRLRAEFGFKSVPLVVHYRARSRRASRER